MVQREIRDKVMAISPHVKRLRDVLGSERILLPSVSVLAWDDADRLLLVKSASSGHWHTIGGAVEFDEHPRECAEREALEEAGVVVEISRIVDVLGGPAYYVIYENGDHTSYVTTVYEATVKSGTPKGDGDETSDARWFELSELKDLDLGHFTRALFHDLGIMPA